MCCSECERDLPLVNKYYKLCQECNNIRLHGSKFGKQYKNTLNSKKSFKSANKPKKFQNKKKDKNNLFRGTVSKVEKVDKIEEDEIFYEKCFNMSDHKCEECNQPLPDRFRDDNGKVIARWRYSHIVAKSIAPWLRHHIDNINHLCLKHHDVWDFGKEEDKKSMKIYKKNKLRWPQFLD